jgi:hypothetical protein
VNKFLLACSGTFLLAAACAQNGPGSSPGTAGSSGGDATGSGGNGPGNGGTTGAGGTTGTGGDTSPGSGGSAGNSSGGSAGSGSGGSAGNPGNGGSAGNGSGGSAGSGGSGGSGNPGNGGRGGTTGAGGTAGSAGARGGAGGSGGTAGSAGGRGGTTGTGGTGGGTCPTIDTLIPNLDGYYWEVAPSGNTSLSGTNYPFGSPGGGCPTGANWDSTGYVKTFPAFPVGGTQGQRYTINMTIRGVVGTRCYTGGMPGSTAMGSGTGQNNTWYVGGVQAGDSIWNTMELRVMPKVTGVSTATYQTNPNYDIYFTNSFQNSGNNWCQKEATYETRFNATFPVMGGGSITPVVHDSNCRTLQNCGQAENQTTCDTSASRKIDMSGLNPAAPTSFSQPRTGVLNGTTYYIQWVWIDVTSVTCN